MKREKENDRANVVNINVWEIWVKEIICTIAMFM